jgi:hypothetical protein
VKQRSTNIFVGPLKREGITSIENEERVRQGKHLAQLSNAGMVKQMKELGIIPDDMGVDMSHFTGNIAALPSGITSLENVQREGDVAHQIEQFNAGILNQEHREQKALMDIAKKRKQSEYRQKIIQWLAETDELDEVPAEFAEEVAAYYANHEGKEAEVARKSKQRKEREETERRAAQREEQKRINRERNQKLIVEAEKAINDNDFELMIDIYKNMSFFRLTTQHIV